jgi:hypothetical protein
MNWPKPVQEVEPFTVVTLDIGEKHLLNFTKSSELKLATFFLPIKNLVKKN